MFAFLLEIFNMLNIEGFTKMQNPGVWTHVFDLKTLKDFLTYLRCDYLMGQGHQENIGHLEACVQKCVMDAFTLNCSFVTFKYKE